MKYLGLVMGLVGALAAQKAQATAVVKINNSKKLLEARSEIIFYGPVATQEVAQKAAQEVERYWNGSSNLDQSTTPLTVEMNGNRYTLAFTIQSQVVSEAEAKSLIASNRDPARVFIQLQQGNSANGDRSYMIGLGANQGLWYLSDDLGKSTTAPHEFGHGLGLPHPDESDWRGKGQPGIMCARGYWVDAQYQWSPEVGAGQPGGTINPYKRKVIQWDVDQLDLAHIGFDSSGTGIIGDRPGMSLTIYGPETRTD